MHLAVIM